MPLTTAHPVAAIPLRRPLGRLGVLAGLVIGSITPDLPLFLPLPVGRNAAHSFDVPAETLARSQRASTPNGALIARI